LGKDFSIERYLGSQESNASRRNLTDFLAHKSQISEASEKYSMRQIWMALKENGKYSGSYNSFTYYFRRFLKQAKGNEDKSLESILEGNAKLSPTEVGEKTRQKSSDWNGKKPYCFEIPKNTEEEL